jgi:hypothetical protein
MVPNQFPLGSGEHSVFFPHGHDGACIDPPGWWFPLLPVLPHVHPHDGLFLIWLMVGVGFRPSKLFSCWLVVWNMAFIFPYVENNHSNWLIFFRGVETTNQHVTILPFLQRSSEILDEFEATYPTKSETFSRGLTKHISSIKSST